MLYSAESIFIVVFLPVYVKIAWEIRRSLMTLSFDTAQHPYFPQKNNRSHKSRLSQKNRPHDCPWLPRIRKMGLWTEHLARSFRAWCEPGRWEATERVLLVPSPDRSPGSCQETHWVRGTLPSGLYEKSPRLYAWGFLVSSSAEDGTWTHTTKKSQDP